MSSATKLSTIKLLTTKSSTVELTRIEPAPARTLSASAAKMRLLKKLRCTLRYEKRAWASGALLVAGVDEVGRGSLFGPVVAAAVILDPGYRIRGLRDSKLLLPERREELAPRIRAHALAWAVASVDAAQIDQINIYQASRLAMREAVMRLTPAADHLLVDAMRLDCDLRQDPIIHGDALSASIAAASILAKVERPRIWPPCGSTAPPRYIASRSRQCGRIPRRRRRSGSCRRTKSPPRSPIGRPDLKNAEAPLGEHFEPMFLFF